MKSRKLSVLFMALSCFIFGDLLFGQQDQDTQKPRDRINSNVVNELPWTEERALRLISNMYEWDKEGDYASIYDFMTALHGALLEIKSDRVVQEILKFPENRKNVVEAKLLALRHSNENPGVKDYMVKTLENENRSIKTRAASILLDWGDWEPALPVIVDNEAYMILQMVKDDRAIPYLKEALTTGSWQGRIYAAAALFHAYGDSTAYPDVALDIVNNAPLNTSDETIIRAKYLAIQAVGKFNLMSSVPALVRLAFDNAERIQRMATSALGHFKRVGSLEALKGLEKIASENQNGRIRSLATSEINRVINEEE